MQWIGAGDPLSVPKRDFVCEWDETGSLEDAILSIGLDPRRTRTTSPLCSRNLILRAFSSVAFEPQFTLPPLCSRRGTRFENNC